jgi:nitrite reductase/ring-hydroxylating ferredoxin subunit
VVVPASPSSARELVAKLSALAEGRPIACSSSRGELIVLRTALGVRAFENRCPHRGTSLDWAPGRFLSPDGAFLQCATHDALFRFDDGLCVAGPCVGDMLTPCAVVVDVEVDGVFLSSE